MIPITLRTTSLTCMVALERFIGRQGRKKKENSPIGATPMVINTVLSVFTLPNAPARIRARTESVRGRSSAGP